MRNARHPFAFLLFAFLLNTSELAAQVTPHLDWVSTISGASSMGCRSIVLDKDGNSYTTGDFWGTTDFDPGPGTYNLTSTGGWDAFVSKLDVNGNLVWARAMNGASYNMGYGVAVDADGNVYTTGWLDGTVDFDPGPGTYNLTANNGSGYYDIYIQKLDANGNFVWAKSMGASSHDEGWAIGVDGDGNIYLTGSYAYTIDIDPGPGVTTLTSGDYSATFVAKFNSSGNLIWAKGIDGLYDQEAYALAVDAAGSVIVTGHFYASTVDFDPGAGVFNLTPVSSSTDAYIFKLDTNGNFAWAMSIGGIYGDYGQGLTTDAAGNIYATGIFNGTADFDYGPGTANLTSTNAADTYILKLDTDGNYIWALNMASTGPTNNASGGVAVDAAGNIYTAGSFYGNIDLDPGAGVASFTSVSGTTDAYVAKLDANGNYLWGFAEGGTSYEEGISIAVDDDEKVYIGGRFVTTTDFEPGPCVFNVAPVGASSFVQKIYQGAPVPGPTIASFTPVSGQVGTEVVITGTNFSTVPADNVVKFTNNRTATVTASTTTSITTTVPASTVTGKISVTTNCITATSVDNFTIVAAGTPTITSFTPTSGPAGTAVTITGTNFSPTPAGNLVKFNGITASVSASSVTSITTTVPASATTGKITVTVAGLTGTSATNFTVTAANTITINPQPTQAAVCSGETPVFTTSATGTTNIAYQWQYATTSTGTYADLANNNHYAGATTSTLSVSTTGNFGAGYYRCKISGDLAATVFTNAVQLTVNNIPTAPGVQGDSSCPPATFTLTATGAGNGSYRWYTAATGGQPLPANGDTFTTPALTATTTYYVSVFNGLCESTRTAVVATVENCDPPVIIQESVSTPVGGKITLDLKPLITTQDLDLASLRVASMPSSGALASIDQQGILTIDYAGRKFAGRENITIEACDLNGRCAQQDLPIDVVADILVYNAVSPEGKNPFLRLEYIELMDDTKKNTVTIYNRWGDEVCTIADYDNACRVFNGRSGKGDKLPSGTYYFKVAFASGRKGLSGFIDLRY